MRLDATALSHLPASIAVPAYARKRTRIGVLHLGAGAFHRAHQAVYLDELLATEKHWAISAVSLHGTEVRDALAPQHGLYTLALLEEQPRLRVIGSIREVLSARDQSVAVLARLVDPEVRLLTLTITEKGYCLAREDLDLEHPDIVRDLTGTSVPVSAIGYIVAGLAARRARGLAPFTVLSCDNLADNGGRLRRAVMQFAEHIDVTLAHWIGREVAFPRSMVDSITPATDDALRDRVSQALGCIDAWPVQREPFSQWVIEDNFCNGRPALDWVGVQFSSDIAAYERAKLRLLNGAHSTLAYVGSLQDIETVADAMREPRLSGFVERLMREDIAPTLSMPAGFDAAGYVDAILTRFRNPAVRHRLSQIAWDGSQKLPVRIVGTMLDALATGRSVERLCVPIAAWMHFVRRQARREIALIDPLASRLSEIGRSVCGDARADVEQFLSVEPGFAAIARSEPCIAALRCAYERLGEGGALD